MGCCIAEGAVQEVRDLLAGEPGFVVVEFERFVLVGAVPGEWVRDGAKRVVSGMSLFYFGCGIVEGLTMCDG